jgi:hypothetical protein
MKREFFFTVHRKIPKYYFRAFYHGTSVRAGSPKAQTITQGTKLCINKFKKLKINILCVCVCVCVFIFKNILWSVKSFVLGS